MPIAYIFLVIFIAAIVAITRTTQKNGRFQQFSIFAGCLSIIIFLIPAVAALASENKSQVIELLIALCGLLILLPITYRLFLILHKEKSKDETKKL